jgi:hypothetical protein
MPQAPRLTMPPPRARPLPDAPAEPAEPTAPPSAGATSTEHDELDELDELPPIDGERGDEPEADPEVEDFEEPAGADAGGAAGLDDSTGENDPLDDEELEGDEAESGWLGEETDSASLDLGEALLVDAGEETASLEDGEEPPAADEDFGIDEGAERTALDPAEEGPVNADEDLRDEDLPALDADDGPEDEGRPADEGMLDERIAGDEPLGLPWAADPWVRVGPPLGLSWMGLSGGITAMACASKGVLLAGRSEAGSHELVRVDLEGGRNVLPAQGLRGARIGSLAAEGDAVAAVSEGRLLVSRDAAATFEPVPVPEGVAAAEVVLASGLVWVRTRTGSLLAARPGKPLERRAVPGVVAALAADGAGGVVGLAVDEAGRPATLVHGREDGTVRCEAVEAPAGRPAPVLSARGEHAAYVVASSRGGIVVRGPDGTWQRLAWEGRVTALALVDDGGTLLAAMYSEADDTTGLVRLDPAGRATVVGRLGAARDDAEADGRTVSMAWDGPRGVVWVAGGFGVAAFATK